MTASLSDQDWEAVQFRAELRMAELERLLKSWRLWAEAKEQEASELREWGQDLESVLADLVDHVGTPFEAGCVAHAKDVLRGEQHHPETRKAT